MEENKEIVENENTTTSEESKAKEVTVEEKLTLAEEKYLRIYADFENYKRRSLKEKEDLITDTKVKMLKSILDMDNDLTYAIQSIKSEEAKSGLELISSKLSNFLKIHGIEEIQTETYNEDLHEVISVMEVGESKIVDVVSKGYTLNGKPFRYPKIILGK